ncbi:D-cysteine desulfhydrase [Zhongshania aliphaticivorans]|uniref:D-cysteine desulfhydrase n=1 Tax=Zhongshania aliphaticivorans TaxID=1470434 RepID=A0A5S9Q905_9GAMM|nr:pyridoxal-phosphate dependent enzyme [Zhongshania aliphaticivorans]CAA0087120.1 D-cysteine desulfhydrase [Zhongshania aliphaticivorans]CAA0114089.1 D-cysteine desulfhydrase [Zhongshania aliphaticivorans]
MIQHVFTSPKGVRVDMLRLDVLNSLAPGNKWFKLIPNFLAAESAGATRLLSFGGAFSNHLHALAAMGKAKGLETIACVRADKESEITPTLYDAQQWGMTLHYLSRSDYRRRHDAAFVAELLDHYPKSYLVPEGGGNALGAIGCRDIVDLIPGAASEYTAVVLACGTGTTLAGVASKVAAGVEVIGVPVLKAEKFMASDISNLLSELGGDPGNWRLDNRFHGGAYARLPSYMAEYMQMFEGQYGVLLDPVYTVKASYAVHHMVEYDEFPAMSRILMIHTGGLQGRRGFGLALS